MVMTAKEAFDKSVDELWERYGKMIEEYVALGCTQVTVSKVPNWARPKLKELGYTLEEQAHHTIIKWDMN